jgi:hypothetical protein
MKFTKFIKGFFLLNIFFLSLISIFVYLMDPYWTFSHFHKFNSLQKSINEREQKSSLLYFQHKQYNALLLGTSRVTFINQNDFKNMNVFNYSFSLANPINLNEYIEFAKKQNKKDFEYIIIGLDFLGTNINAEKNQNPKEVFDEVTGFLYRYKLLFSVDAFTLGIENLKRSILNKPGGRSYNRENVAFTTNFDPSEVRKRVEEISVDEQNNKLKNYKYNEKYKEVLEKIRNSNPNSKFIVFTTPVSTPYLNRIIENGFYDSYKKWLDQSVEVFGQITHFMDKNSITNDYSKYFMDYHHVYPEYTHLIVDKLQDINATSSGKDFGVVLNKENIKSYIKNLD